MKKKRLKKRCFLKIAVLRHEINKNVLLLGIFMMFGLWNYASAQTKNVTLNVKDMALREVFKLFKEQTGTNFIYSDLEMQKSFNVTLKFENLPLKVALERIFKDQPYTFEIRGDIVVIKPVSQKKGDTGKKKIRIIRGRITDEDGQPIPGANVWLKGTTTGTPSDVDGNYTLSFDEKYNAVVVSFVGYKSMEETIGNREVINFKLSPDEEAIDEVLVTGYQTISKERATGAFDIIDHKTIDRPSASIAQRLVGVAPGVAASLDSEGNVSLVIRGRGTLNTNARPLLIVDGFPIEGGFSSINPNDVESISILKDAAAASIWGARASNGVIVITTKKEKAGKKQGMKVEVSAHLKLGSKPDVGYMRNVASSADMIKYEKSIFGKYGIQALGSDVSSGTFNSSYGYTYTQAGMLYNKFATKEISENEMNDGLEQLKTRDNTRQIQKYLMQRPIYHQYNVSLSSATERMANYISLLYGHNDRRNKKNHDSNLQFNYRGVSKLLKWMDLNLSATIIYNENGHSGISPESGMAPYDMLVNPDGTYANLNHLKFYTPMIDTMVPKENFPYSDWSYNPITEMNNRELTFQTINLRFQGGLTFKIIEGLTFDTKYQYERIQGDSRNLYNEQTFYVRNMVNTSSTWDKKTGKVTPNLPAGSILEQSKTITDAYNFRNQVNFTRIFSNMHAVNFVGGIEISQDRSKGYIYAPTYGYDDAHLTVGIFPNGTKDLKNWTGNDLSLNYINKFSYLVNRYFSAFANLSYTFEERYSISGSYRTDASNFITDDPRYRYSPFWSVGFSWNMVNEGFMQNIQFIDYLKLRVTYGCNGNADSSTSVVPLIKMLGYNQQSGELEAKIWSKGNPSLRWERTNTLNLGTDFNFFGNKLHGKVDYYYKYGKDILGNIAIPMINGATSATINNAEITNHGIEFELGSGLAITKDLKWNGTVTFACNKNKIKKLFRTSVPYWWLSGEGASGFHVEGRPINSIFSYVYAGMENVGTADSPKMMPVVKLKDGETMPFGGTTTYDGLDFLAYQGTTVAPYHINMNHTFSCKEFELSFILTGKFGHIFRRTGFNYPGRGGIPNAQITDILNADPSKMAPMPYQDSDELVQWNKTRYLDYQTTRANNVRMQEMAFSYTLPKRLLQQWGIDRLTIYLQGNNLFTLKSIKEDPEYLYGSFRLQPNYTAGIKFGF